MSSTPQSIPLTRRIQGGRVTLIAIGVLLAVALAVTLIAVSNKNTVQTTHARTSQANVASMPHVQYLGPRQVGRTVVNVPGPAAAVGKSASSPTVHPKPESATPNLSSVLGSLSPQQRRYVLAIAALSPRELGAGYGTARAAAVGNTASSSTAQPNPDQQESTAHTLKLLRDEDLPGSLLR